MGLFLLTLGSLLKSIEEIFQGLILLLESIVLKEHTRVGDICVCSRAAVAQDGGVRGRTPSGAPRSDCQSRSWWISCCCLVSSVPAVFSLRRHPRPQHTGLFLFPRLPPKVPCLLTETPTWQGAVPLRAHAPCTWRKAAGPPVTAEGGVMPSTLHTPSDFYPYRNSAL